MIRLYAKHSGGGTLVEQPAGELDAVRAAAEWIWLDLADAAADQVRDVGHRLGIDPLSVEDMLDVTQFPKVDHHSAYLFVILHGVVAEGQERLSTEELDLIIGRDFLVTAHRAPMVAVDWVRELATTNEILAATGPAGLASAIAEAGGRRYLPLLDALDEGIESLEDAALAADPRTLTESQAFRRDVIVLRRILGPQREVLRELSHTPSPLLDDATRRAFSDVYDHHFRLVESLDAARSLLGSVLDTYRGAVAERTNEVMKVLTVFSAILLPLGLVAGLWGMNFSEIPGSGWRWGFFGLLGAMSLFAVGLWGYFARRGFVGGPKLRRLPKAVGLGLVHIGTAPLRVVTGLIDTLLPEEGDGEGDGPPTSDITGSR